MRPHLSALNATPDEKRRIYRDDAKSLLLRRIHPPDLTLEVLTLDVTQTTVMVVTSATSERNHNYA